MEVVKKFFPAIMLENESIYFSSLIGVVESVDELASLEITKTPDSYKFRLVPSLPKYMDLIIAELLQFHNILGLRLNMGKSIKSTAIVSFKIPVL